MPHWWRDVLTAPRVTDNGTAKPGKTPTESVPCTDADCAHPLLLPHLLLIRINKVITLFVN